MILSFICINFIVQIDDLKVPPYSTVSNFMNEMLVDSIEDIFNDINSYTFPKENVDLNHVYIDGTKLEANANKYTRAWKKACKTTKISSKTKNFPKTNKDLNI